MASPDMAREVVLLIAPPNKRMERTRHEHASLVSCVGELLSAAFGATFLKSPRERSCE